MGDRGKYIQLQNLEGKVKEKGRQRDRGGEWPPRE